MFSLAFRTRRYGIEYEYEYHFVEYEYDKSQSCATSKTMAGAIGGFAQKPRNTTRKSHTFVWVGPVRRT